MNLPEIDQTTLFSLLCSLQLLLAAIVASGWCLPWETPAKIRVLFVWHFFDSLTHFFFEGSFLYNCFNVYRDISGWDSAGTVADKPFFVTPPGVYFLGQRDRLYGALYGDSPVAKLWQEYAAADKRWGGADLTVISLELLTVFIGGPLAMWVCYMLAKGEGLANTGAFGKGGKKIVSSKVWFWIVVLATGELYGGFMTFSPEWLSGNPNLNTSSPFHLWVYLVFFNVLWVFFPIWAMYEAYGAITGRSSEPLSKKTGGKKDL